MALVEKLPPAVESAVSQRSISLPEIVVATPGDLDLRGRFAAEWLVLTRDRMLVCTLDGPSCHVRLDVPLREVKAARSDSLVGGASLLATLDGTPREIVRFTNAHQRKFGRIAKYLNDLAQYTEAQERGETGKESPKLEEDAEDDRRCPKCQLPLVPGTKVCPACMSKSQAALRLIAYLRPYWKLTVSVWALMVLTTLINLVPPYLTRPLVDEVLLPKVGNPPVPDRISLLGWLVLLLLSVRILHEIVQILCGRLVVRLGTQLSHDLRSRLYEHLQFMSLRFFEKRQTGAMIARVTRDTESVEDVIVFGAQHFVINMLTLIGIAIVLISINWRLTLLVLVPIPFVILLSRLFWFWVMRLWGRFWHSRQRLTAAVNDSLSGIRVVKAFAQEDQEVTRFNTHSIDLLRTSRAAEFTWVSFFPILGFITSSGMLLVWYFGGRQVIREEISLGTLMMFISYLGFFYAPLHFLSRVADFLARALTSSERVFEILDSEPDVKEAEDAVAMPRIEGRVEFRDVTFGYDRHKPVLKNVQLDVQPGEMIGLVGHSGAGKTTTVNLICRFYDVDQGEIVLDGVSLRKIRQKDLRSQIGVVLQDTFLFNGTIAENIRYAKPEATMEELMAAAKAANAHDFILQKPDGYDTQVGERGQSLSGGERQRVAIARAILHNPRLLILDEATSSVDTDTEKQIQEAIARLVKGRTTFAIAHRLSTLRNANRLVVLKDGKVQEMGTHDELLDKKGEFHRLVQMQQEMSRIREVVR